MRSMFSAKDDSFDMRYLQMELEFFGLTKEQSDTMLESFVFWYNQTFSNFFIINWYAGNRKIKTDKLPNVIYSNEALELGMEGGLICDKVYNQKTLNQHVRSFHYPSTGNMGSIGMSLDYMSFYNEKISIIEDDNCLKKTILSFFSEPNRHGFSTMQRLELDGSITRLPYRNNDKYYGTMNVSVSVYSLDSDVKSYAEKMVIFLQQQAERWTNINGRVAVAPSLNPSKCSGHMYYFGNNVAMDDSHLTGNFMPVEWYPHYYICGAEWFNIISPLAQQHIPKILIEAARFPSLTVQALAGGCISVHLKKEPDCIDIADLLPVKLLLYNALYPGMSEVPKQVFFDPGYTGYIAKPRKQWECVPMLEEEVIITKDSIIFRHRNCRA